MRSVPLREPIPTPALEGGISVAVEPAFDIGGEEYADLFAASGATAFQSPIWLAPLFRNLAAARNAEPVVVTGRVGERLVFALPLILRRLAGIRLLEAADLGVSDYAAPVVDRDWLKRLGNDLGSLAGMVEAALPAHDVLRIKPIRDEHLAIWRLFIGAAAKQLAFSAHELSLTGITGDWRKEALSPGFFKTLDRKRRKFNGQPGARVRLLTTDNELRAGIDGIAQLRDGRFEGDLIALDAVRRFYADIAIDGRASGFSAIYAVEVGGSPIGYAFGVTHAGRFNYLLIGCDYAGHGRLSPGLILYDRMIDDWRAIGGTIFDFTIGDEPFKADFGTKPVPMWELSDVPTVRGRLFLALREARDRIRGLRRRAASDTE